MNKKVVYNELDPESASIFDKVLTEEERFSLVHPSQRVLLISHCLRNSKICKAISEEDGLKCLSCDPSCQVNAIQKKAKELNYKGICIAPGGSMALRFVKNNRPHAIAAVACMKELEEGIESVKRISSLDDNQIPPILIVPLTKEGCVNTEVDVGLVIEKLSLGCI